MTWILFIFQYEKLVLKNGKIIKEEYVTEGRKVPLKEIREKMLLKQDPYLRKHDDEWYEKLSENQLKKKLSELNELTDGNMSVSGLRENLKTLQTTRNLLVWLDNSTVANHGYMVCLITCLYDSAVFMTNKEVKEKTGKDVSVQKLIEQPEVHFIARCSSSDQEQLLTVIQDLNVF